MSTRSRIGIEREDGTVESIYCHFDGYPAHVGKMLLEHYQDGEKIEELLKLGNISSLGAEISEVDAYHRDHKEDWVSTRPKKSANLAEVDQVLKWCEDNLYISRGGQWYYTALPYPVELTKLVPLTQEVIANDR